MTTAKGSQERTERAGELNPYAPPQVGEAAEPFAEAGIGAWRDGDQLVLHEEATLPPVCIRCGQPAGRWRSRVLVWPFVSRWRLKFRMPMCRRCRFYRTACVLVAPPLGLIAVVLLFATFPDITVIGWWRGKVPGTILVLYGALFAASVTLLASVMAFSIAFEASLPHVRTHGRYHWFRGPWGGVSRGRGSSGFLDHLPEWPYGK